MSDPFSGFTLGPTSLANRIVMAPMTRHRAIGNVPNELMARYYAQRAEAGLIVTEATAPSPNALGYARMPGLFDGAHVEGWRQVTSAVHAAGSRIFVQLMHAGRIGHPGNMPAGARLLAPSAVGFKGKVFTDADGEQPAPVPSAMTEPDIEEAISEFARAAELAIEAGFDGVELHGANGYLIDQFFDEGANRREDRWGGIRENRIRFGLEVARAVAAKLGPNQVGMRVSPYNVANDVTSVDEDLHELFAASLGALGLAYMHIVDHSSLGTPEVKPTVKRRIRQAFKGSLILSGGYDLTRAKADLAAGHADLIAFGRPFIANPNLVTKLREGQPLAAPDFATVYTPGPVGYTDY